jgi:hypothetical protein
MADWEGKEVEGSVRRMMWRISDFFAATKNAELWIAGFRYSLAHPECEALLLIAQPLILLAGVYAQGEWTKLLIKLLISLGRSSWEYKFRIFPGLIIPLELLLLFTESG